eukprot:Seg832.12 transcript_id=Seg832.12/GoldUCD/mRNA.D3Y31 product="Potassium voltage-gated channel subfamily A member 2" protein_id=Seg832.12/GoldUCD/D3Y31
MAGQEERERIEARVEKDFQFDFSNAQPNIQRCISDMVHGVLIREDTTAFNCKETAGTTDVVKYPDESSDSMTENVKSSGNIGETCMLRSARANIELSNCIGKICCIADKAIRDQASLGLCKGGGDSTADDSKLHRNIEETLSLNSARTKSGSGKKIGELCYIETEKTNKNRASLGLNKRSDDRTTDDPQFSGNIGEACELSSVRNKSTSSNNIREFCYIEADKTYQNRASPALCKGGCESTAEIARLSENIKAKLSLTSAGINAVSSKDIRELCYTGTGETSQNQAFLGLHKENDDSMTENANSSRNNEETCKFSCATASIALSNNTGGVCTIGAETKSQNRVSPRFYERNCNSTTVLGNLDTDCCLQDHSTLLTGIDPIVLSPVTLELYHRRRNERNSVFNFEPIEECSELDLVLIGEDRSLYSSSCLSDVRCSCPDLTDDQKEAMPKATRNFQISQKKKAIVYKRCSDMRSSEDQQASRIALNVGGILYETYENTLAVFPDTLLGDPDRRIKYYDQKTDQYILARNSDCFDAILFYYQSNGILSKPLTVDRLTFESELEFFQINCRKTKKIFSDREWNPAARGGLPSRKTPRKVLSKLFHRPFSSMIASIIAYFSIFIIIVSTIEFCIETLPQYRILSKKETNRGKGKRYGNRMRKHAVLDVIEAICMSCFTIDFLIRIYIAPKRWKFIHSLLGIIDIVSLLPFYISLLSSHSQVPDNFVKFIELVRQLRLLQVFRLSRYSYGFRALLETISKSLMQLASFIFVIPIMAMFFAVVTFFAEDTEEKSHEQCRNQCKKFGSLSDWFWYSVITMTTVGYGDVYPRTILGKMIGASCAIFGVVLFCLLTPIIFRHFVETYYVRGVMSRNITIERRRLAEKVTEMYYEQYEN